MINSKEFGRTRAWINGCYKLALKTVAYFRERTIPDERQPAIYRIRYPQLNDNTCDQYSALIRTPCINRLDVLVIEMRVPANKRSGRPSQQVLSDE
jgi:hypothetical protein